MKKVSSIWILSKEEVKQDPISFGGVICLLLDCDFTLKEMRWIVIESEICGDNGKKKCRGIEYVDIKGKEFIKCTASEHDVLTVLYRKVEEKLKDGFAGAWHHEIAVTQTDIDLIIKKFE